MHVAAPRSPSASEVLVSPTASTFLRVRSLALAAMLEAGGQPCWVASSVPATISAIPQVFPSKGVQTHVSNDSRKVHGRPSADTQPRRPLHTMLAAVERWNDRKNQQQEQVSAYAAGGNASCRDFECREGSRPALISPGQPVARPLPRPAAPAAPGGDPAAPLDAADMAFIRSLLPLGPACSSSWPRSRLLAQTP